MPALNPEIHKDNPYDQAGEVFASKSHEGEGEERDPKGDSNGKPRSVFVGEMPDAGGAEGTRRADEAKHARHRSGAPIVVGRRLQEEDECRPERAECRKEERSKDRRFSQGRMPNDEIPS